MVRKIIKGSAIFLAIAIVGWLLYYNFYFLRNPDRHPPNNPTAFVSPANGVVASVTHWTADSLVITKGSWGAIKEWTPDIGESGTMVSITMNLANVHYQRVPIKGTYIGSTYTKGAFHNALKHDNEYGTRFENEHNSFLFQSAKGTKYKVIQIAGFAARRIVDDMKDHPNTPVEQGQTIGMIKMGSQVTLLFPENVSVSVKKGDVLIDGESVIAKEL